jgi:hypothetical protein
VRARSERSVLHLVDLNHTIRAFSVLSVPFRWVICSRGRGCAGWWWVWWWWGGGEGPPARRQAHAQGLVTPGGFTRRHHLDVAGGVTSTATGHAPRQQTWYSVRASRILKLLGAGGWRRIGVVSLGCRTRCARPLPDALRTPALRTPFRAPPLDGGLNEKRLLHGTSPVLRNSAPPPREMR